MTACGDGDRHEVRREELYAQVWSEPMVRLAKRYGVSDVALAKVCRKLDIPVPPRGYWRRLQTGWRPAAPALPKLPPGRCDTATITPQAHQHGSGEGSAEVGAQEGFERQTKNRIRVQQRLVDPHPLVRHTAQVLRSARPGPYGTLAARREKCLDLRVGPRSLERALRIIDALVKALEHRGFRVGVSTDEKPRTQVEILGQRLTIMLDERIKRTEHSPKNGERYGPKWDYVPSGELRLKIDEWVGGSARKTWSDGVGAQLEGQLNSVIVGLVVIADVKRAWEQEREREEAACREAERRRILAEQARREEQQRRLLLERQAESWSKSQQLRAFIDEVERRATAKAVSTAPDSELGAWIAWARQHADRLDPLARDPDSDAVFARPDDRLIAADEEVSDEE
jgi:hypothetical protein